MLQTIQTFFTMYWHIIIPIITTLFLIIPIMKYWETIRYGLMLVRHHLPFFGKIRYWVKHPGEQDAKSHFLSSESELCESYYHYYQKHAKDGSFFKKCEDYLMKINEDHRKEKGIGLWILIITLMVIEASAFGYALAPYALSLATPNTALAAAFGIGLVISIIALLLSELTGRQLYLNHMVGQIMSYNSLRQQGEAGDFVRKDLINIDNTYTDNERPAYQQMLNRIKVPRKKQKPTTTYGITISYIVFILILAIAAFWVRAETLKAQEADLIANPIQMSLPEDDFPDSEDDFPLTDTMSEVQNESQNKSAQDQIDAMHRASLVTFGVLSCLFVFIQFTSTFLAYSRGFAGNKSLEAWRQTHRFANADEYVAYHRSKARSIAVDAQQALGKLQALLSAQFHISGNEQTSKETNKHVRTFEKFVEYKHSENLLESTKNRAEGILVGLLKQIDDLNNAGKFAEAHLAFQKAAPILASLPAEQVPQALRDQIKVYEQTFTVLDSTQALPVTPAPVSTPAPTVVPIPVPVHLQSTIESLAPEAILSTATVSSIPPGIDSRQAAAKPAFNPHAWGDLTDLLEEDLAFVAKQHGVEESLIRRAYKLQMLGKRAV